MFAVSFALRAHRAVRMVFTRAAILAKRRFDEVRRLAHYVLFDRYDYLNRLAREAKNVRGLHLELADGYLRLGDIQGDMFRTNLDDTRAALGPYREGPGYSQSASDDPGAVRLRTLIELHRA